MKRFPILLNNKKYSTDFQTLPEFAKGWRTVLTKAHGGVGYCLCKPLSPDLRKISIKFKEATDLYSLARFGNTESEHDPECRFAQEYSEQSRQIPSTGSNTGIEKTKDSVLVKFHIGINTAKKLQPRPSSTPSSTYAPRQRRVTIKSLRLLQLLWEEAGLNIWHPVFEGKRNYFNAFQRLSSASQNIHVNAVNLHKILLLQTTESNESKSGHNEKTTSAAIANQQKLFVIAKLARFNVDQHTPYPTNLPITGYFGIPWVKVSPELWERTEAAQPTAYEHWKSGGDVIAIAIVQPATNKSSAALEIALMPVSEKLLPIQ